MQNASRVKQVLLKIDNANLRIAFNRYRMQSDQISLAIDINQTGPQTEFVFEANRAIKNLKNFMLS